MESVSFQFERRRSLQFGFALKEQVGIMRERICRAWSIFIQSATGIISPELVGLRVKWWLRSRSSTMGTRPLDPRHGPKCWKSATAIGISNFVDFDPKHS
jgi:hypothetical protein